MSEKERPFQMVQIRGYLCDRLKKYQKIKILFRFNWNDV